MSIDWSLAVRVAAKVAGSYPLEGTYHEALLRKQAPELVAKAAELVAEETRVLPLGVPTVEVVTRTEWVERNLAVFSRLLEPATERLEGKQRRPGLLGPKLVGAELGGLLGVIARMVLGQYELVLPAGDGNGDTIYLVGANVLSMERRYSFRPSEFRLWIALHECAHRFQFVGVPWLRDHFLSLVSQLVASAVPEPGQLARVMQRVRQANRSGEPIIGEAGLFGLFASPTQKEQLDRVQALMALLEGHGHVVMDRIGERVLVTQNRMSRVLRQRRKDPRTATFFRLAGLEMKMRQYELGQQFVLGVERTGGWEALDRVWSSPEALPTRLELSDPAAWLARTG